VTAGGDQQQFSVRLLLAGGRSVEHGLRDDALGDVVASLEVAAAGGGDPTGPEQELQRCLGVGPVPAPVLAAAGLVPGDVPRGDRTDVEHLGVHLLDVARTLLGEPGDPSPGLEALLGPLHPPPHQRMQVDRQQRRLVSPVLEQLVVAVGQIVDEGHRIGPEPGVRRKVVRPGEHVDAVDLEQRRVPQHPAQVAPVRCRGRAGDAEALRDDGEAPRRAACEGPHGRILPAHR
jgi:hypothetical protein